MGIPSVTTRFVRLLAAWMRRLLRGLDFRPSGLHAAILELLDRLPMDAVEAVVIEPAVAIDRAWQPVSMTGRTSSSRRR
jgi:hypothetical protein